MVNFQFLEYSVEALKTVFEQATAFLFQDHVPTPIEITKAAVRYFPFSNRNFPNKGLSEEQTAQAIRDVGLEPYLVTASDPDLIKATFYAYQKAGIPLIMGFGLEGMNSIENRDFPFGS